MALVLVVILPNLPLCMCNEMIIFMLSLLDLGDENVMSRKNLAELRVTGMCCLVKIRLIAG